MAIRLPTLNALKAFEAAGRHQSFKAAADELHVTPGAISRQIKSLEETLGIQLFVRSNREVRLTPESAAFLASLSTCFRQMEIATSSFVRTSHEGPLRLVCSMSLAMRWLLPRLPRFHVLYPHRHISLNTSLSPVASEVDTMTTDVVIRMGTPDWPDEIVHHFLFKSDQVAVCSPKLLETGPPLRCLEDLRRHTILMSLLRPQTWPLWLQAAGLSELDLSRAVTLESSALTYSAALEGLGVALAERSLLGDDLESGRLVAPLDFSFQSPEGFYLIYPRQLSGVTRVEEFKTWILSDIIQHDK